MKVTGRFVCENPAEARIELSAQALGQLMGAGLVALTLHREPMLEGVEEIKLVVVDAGRARGAQGKA